MKATSQPGNPTTKRIRCAIYTRKSSDEGLDQAFNSLHAQREACEAYIKSQAHEGWRLVPTSYDDGGLSGGTLERPGLKRLLQDVDAGRVDTIVVYKIDRLTRSLADFARIVERLEKASASFVSVTQAFNTTTSMGRLTLNVLLSFAQFEREVTGERIRDKIRASKRRGMWMGGTVPLGYDRPTDLATRALVPNEVEAETVRMIFTQYLELGSVNALAIDLERTGVRSKAWVTLAGQPRGGTVLGRGALYHLLRNRMYLGELAVDGVPRPDAHPAIVPQDLFDAVGRHLDDRRRDRRERPTRAADMALTGILFDIDGNPMSPTFAYGHGGKLYRYYVSAPLQQGKSVSQRTDAIRRVAVDILEHALADHLRSWLGRDPNTPLKELCRPIRRVELEQDQVHLTITRAEVPRRLHKDLGPHPTDPALGYLTLAIRCRVASGRSWVETDKGAQSIARPDPILIKALRQAHIFAAGIGWTKGAAPAADIARIPSSTYERRLCRLAFLAPDLQKAILTGKTPRNLTLSRLLASEIPLNWADQRKLFGITE